MGSVGRRRFIERGNGFRFVRRKLLDFAPRFARCLVGGVRSVLSQLADGVLDFVAGVEKNPPSFLPCVPFCVSLALFYTALAICDTLRAAAYILSNRDRKSTRLNSSH